MAGTLTISTLSDGTNSTSATNPIRGSAKAWVQLTGSATPTINGSFNVSSITRIGTGEYTFAFTTAMADINYSAVASTTIDASSSNYLTAQVFGSVTSPFYVAPTTSGFRIYFCNNSGIAKEPKYASVAVFD